MAVGFSDEERSSIASGPLGALDDRVIDELFALGSRRSCVGGESVIRQDDDDPFAYVVLHGRLRVVREDPLDGTSHVIAEIGAGEMVGEMALLARGPRTASVVAVRDSELLAVDERAFEAFVQRDVATLRKMTEIIVTRASSRHVAATLPSIVAVVSDGPAGAEVPDRLAAAFGRAGHPVLGVHRREPTDLVQLVERAESGPEMLVLTAGVDDADWARAAVRQADVVLPVASDSEGRAARVVREWLRHRTHRPRVEAIVVGDAPVPPSMVGPDMRRHRLTTTGTADVDRIVRLMTGTANALVLGSGSARGLAHVGVLQAFAERGVPIDAIGGTSAGSIVAGMWAFGRTAEQIRQDFIDFIDNVRWGRDLIFPRFSLLSGRQLSDVIERYFDAARIEDLAIDLFAVTTDLGAGTAVVHDQGLVWKALRASAAIPGVFPPVRDGDRLLGDGAIVDRLPVGVMRDRHPQARVFAVDLATPTGLDARGHAEDGRVSWRRALRPAPRTPGLGSVMGRIIEVTGSSGDLGDVTIRPAIGELSLRNATRAVDQAMAAGRAAALRALAGGSTTM